MRLCFQPSFSQAAATSAKSLSSVSVVLFSHLRTLSLSFSLSLFLMLRSGCTLRLNHFSADSLFIRQIYAKCQASESAVRIS